MHVVPKSIRRLSESEQELISHCISGLEAMFSEILEGTTEVTPETMDVVFSAWMTGFDERGEDPDAVQELVVAFALAFGDFLRTRLGMQWAIAQFEDGEEEFTICRMNAEGSNYIYPISMVAKRFDQREKEFFVALANVLEEANS